jgi:GTP cyclohydrolase IIa
MIRVGLIRLEGYEGWIRSLGHDREWIVQATQAEVYRSLAIESAKAGMFSLPLTYDTYLVVINAADVEGFKGLAHRLSGKAPVALSLYVGLGASYAEAMRRLRPLDEAAEGLLKEGWLDETAAAHLDLDGYNKLASEGGFNYVEELVDATLRKAREASARHGGLAYYAGGDNVVCFVPCERLECFLDDVRVDGVKVGVGVALRPRDALALAARALDEIRLGGRSRGALVLREAR